MTKSRGAAPPRGARTDPRVDAAIAEHGRSPEAILAILREIQARNCGYLDAGLLGATADAVGTSDARVYSVASFYSRLSVRRRRPRQFWLCDGPICRLKGAAAVHAAAAAICGEEWSVERASCLGLCDRAPAALLGLEPCGPVAAGDVASVLAGRRGDMPDYGEARAGETRVALARLGRIDPDSIESALGAGAYRALGAALRSPSAAVLDAVERAGLRGCGGAGFPAGRKWRMVRDARGLRKYVVCNADESEPGAFKDRVLMDGDPHLLLEGMALAAYAVGAGHGMIYIRGEYDWIAERLERAVAQAEETGWLGDDIRGSGFSFRVQVHRGAGAYVCGEESALLSSLEGGRGEPRVRPPYPTTRGYRGQPTVVNNVETLCQVPAIVEHGPQWFRSRGTPGSPGTKIFALTGCIDRPGVFEAPLGITLRRIVEEFSGGLTAGSSFKAALTGGAAGSFVPASLMDVPIDFDSGKNGVMLGCGPIVVLDESVSIPDFLASLLGFFEKESCGKCTPCREGTREARRLSERLARGGAAPGAIGELERLARQMHLTSLCGLGQSVALPVESAVRYFAAEFHGG
ncbi:MAG TPA: NADH-ubiquinone oxidoreductase-F iron-sulfur binding region domain-containing protein [candidate division Zixibacteria bacterium]|nr:NADH-ubiquinone oxidoreductase-F iron-sulfur binding region domain-containing protein [candidate division Zixibacteria bacterium]